MFIDYTSEQKKLRAELKAYFAKMMTPELLDGIRDSESGTLYKDTIRQMGKDGWLALGWPSEYGGQNRSSVEQLIFFEEARLAGAPIPFVTLNTVGPALMKNGSEIHKLEFLPRIAAGDVHFAIGYSEPGAGTDLAALKTSGTRDGDHFVINGTKVFTSGADGADYIWLAVRTDPQAPKHKGISIFIVDTKSEGFSHAPIHTVGGVRTNMTYYNDVRVPINCLVGELNGGWRLITSQLNHERVGLAAYSIYGLGLYDRVTAWARKTMAKGGDLVIDQPWVQSNLAECYAKLEAMRLMNLRMAWDLDKDQLDPAYASAMKIYSTECLVNVYRLLMDVMGPPAALRHHTPGALLLGDLEQACRQCQINTFGGGVNEVQRDIVARFGLNMPAVAR